VSEKACFIASAPQRRDGSCDIRVIMRILFTNRSIYAIFGDMKYTVDENGTRENIIVLLKKSGGMSIEELRREIDITPMGIRQHLIALEKKGIVTYVTKRRGIGRPGFVYMLTDKANELFPTSYADLAIGVLRDIRKHDGIGKIDQIFKWRKDRVLKLRKQALAENQSVDESVRELSRLLQSEGYFVEVSRSNGHYRLKQYHCPIEAVAREFSAACAHELLLYKELLGKNVFREQTITEGSPHCLYIIPAGKSGKGA
jgi:predicted ArsR family transcriptional regulator